MILLILVVLVVGLRKILLQWEEVVVEACRVEEGVAVVVACLGVVLLVEEEAVEMMVDS